MQLKIQKRLAGHVLRCSSKKIKFNPDRLEEIKEAITKIDIKGLVGDKAISSLGKTSSSRGRARQKLKQKRKGRLRGMGNRKGTANARLSKKLQWINKIRIQRQLIKNLVTKKLITTQTYRTLYDKAKGGFFRNRRHIKLYIGEHNLLKKD